MKEMKMRKGWWRKKLVLLIAAPLILSSGMEVFVCAKDTYPNTQSVKNTDGVALTKSAVWQDEKHTDNNYNAVITLKAENLPEVKREPVDVVLMLSSSVYMSSPECSNPSHLDYRIEVDEAQNKLLTDNWESKYQPLLPDETKFTDAEIFQMNSKEFIVPATVGSVQGYLVPIGIYTKESADDLKRFRKRDNWHFAVKNPIQSNIAFESRRLHMGEKGDVINEVIHNPFYPSAFPQYTFESAGKQGAQFGCNSGRGIGTYSAKQFVDIILKADKENRVALIPYADKAEVKASAFSSKKAELDKVVEDTYSRRGGNTNANLPFQKAVEVMRQDNVGNRQFAFFESDGSVVYDTTLAEAGKAAAELRNSGIQTYAAGYRLDDQRSYQYLEPFAYDYNPEKPSTSKYVLSTEKDGAYGISFAMEAAAKAIVEKGTALTIKDYISEYFELDKTGLPANATVTQERVQGAGGERNVQKVTVQIPASELEKKTEVSIALPVTLKKEYQNAREFLNTNHIFADGSKGASIAYELPDGKQRVLAVDSPYLQPDASVPEIKYAELSYDLQGGEAKDGENFDAEQIEVGTKVAEASGYKKAPVKKGYLFGGWYLEPECTNPAGSYTMSESNTTIYAKWVKETTSVTIDLGGGQLEDGTTSLTIEVPVNRPVGGQQWYHYEPKRDGYTFGGWYLDEGCKIPLTEDMLIGDITKIFVKWVENIEEDDKILLYYDTKGGERPEGGGIDPVEVEPGSLISKAPGYEAQIVKQGFEFTGWYLDEECTVLVGEERMPYADKTIYAKWEPVNLLSYDLQGGAPPEGKPMEPEAVDFEALISSAKGYQITPVKEGYVFKGWYLEAECTNPVGDATMPDEDKTIYAKWEPEEEKPEEDNPPKDDPSLGGEGSSDKNTGTGSGSGNQTTASGTVPESASSTANPVAKLVQSIKTGDYNPIVLLVGSLLLSALGITILIKKK